MLVCLVLNIVACDRQAVTLDIVLCGSSPANLLSLTKLTVSKLKLTST